MKHKHIFVFAFLVIIATPFLFNILVNNQQDIVLQTENRKALDFKPLEKFKVRYIAEFFKNYDKYLSDHLIFRDDVVSNFKNITNLGKLNLFVNNFKTAVIGKDNFVFLSDKYNGVLDRHLYGNIKEFNKKYYNMIEDIEYLSKYSKSLDKNFFVLVAPDKHGVYCNKLPSYLSFDTCKNIRKITNDRIIKLEEKGINVVYPLDYLRKISISKNLYYKTDSHWNKQGAEAAFNFLMNEISKKSNFFGSSPNLWDPWKIIYKIDQGSF